MNPTREPPQMPTIEHCTTRLRAILESARRGTNFGAPGLFVLELEILATSLRTPRPAVEELLSDLGSVAPSSPLTSLSRRYRELGDRASDLAATVAERGVSPCTDDLRKLLASVDEALGEEEQVIIDHYWFDSVWAI